MHNLGGAAIEVDDIRGESSGLYEIAELVGRIFPEYRRFARDVWRNMDSPLPTGPYPNDALTYRSRSVVEYLTPGDTDGLGNSHSRLGKNNLPIAGTAILLIGSPDSVDNIPRLVLLSIRLPSDLTRLTPTIIRYVERNIHNQPK